MSPKTRMTSGMQRRKGNDPLRRDGSPGKADPPREKEGRSPRGQGSLPGLDTAPQPERLTGEQE